MKAKRSHSTAVHLEPGYHRVDVDLVVPNTWNMNKVAPEVFRKLKLNIEETLDRSGTIPPILVRPHPTKLTMLEIIDGEHRWRVIKELGYAEIDVHTFPCEDRDAMVLTANLNYLRGEADPEKYPDYLERVIKEHAVDVTWLSERLVESADELTTWLEGRDITPEIISLETDEDMDGVEEKDASLSEAWMELKFLVAREQAEIIEAELDRIAGTLKGKNPRGRALEFMAVLSSQTPTETFADVLPLPAVAEPATTSSTAGTKKKLEAASRRRSKGKP